MLARAPHYLAGPEPVGDDSSSHILASARAAEYLRTGSDGWWVSDLNLGFPLAHFYQPLPHAATGALALLLGGPEEATQAYKLLVVMLLCAGPFATWFGLRRLGFGPVAAACGALALATFSAPKAYYGLTARHYLLSGLYTMAWGAVFVPLALAEGVRFLQGRGRASLAVSAFALLFFTHALLALGLVPVFVFTALFAPEGETRLRARLTRLVVLGGGTGVVIAFWLLPQLVNSDYFGGWPVSEAERANGFGLTRVLSDWLHGRFTDHRRLPVLAVASLFGCAALLFRPRRPTNRIVLFGVGLFVVFSAGRVTFGALVDWVFPPNARIEGMMRWIAMLHFFLALAVATAAGELLERAARGPRWLGISAALAIPGTLLALLVPSYVADLRWGLDTFFESSDRPAYLEIAEALREAPTPGRVYAAEPVGQNSHWVMAYLPLLSGKPGTLSYGVGVQDSLNLFYLWGFGGARQDVLVRDRQRARGACELFDVRYLVVRPGFDGSYLGARTIARRGPYELLELPGEYGVFDLIEAPEVVEDAPPVQLRARFEHWLRAGYPRGARFLRLSRPVHSKLPGLPSATLDYRAEQVGTEGEDFAPRERVRPGRVLAQQSGSNRYSTRVSVEGDEAWLMLKATPHPWWRAEVDGERQPVYHLSPSFQGLPLGLGTHEVVFVFENPGWQKLLLALAPLFLAGLFAFDFLRRRGGPR